MPKLYAVGHRDEKTGKLTRVTIYGSPHGQMIATDGGYSGTPSELVLEIDAHGIKVTVKQATELDGKPIAPEYWQPNQIAIEHPHGTRAIRDAITKFLDQIEDTFKEEM